MSFLSLLGMGNQQKAMGTMDPSQWNYQSAGLNYTPAGYLQDSMNQLNTQAGLVNTAAQNALTKGNQFLDPSSQYYKTQRGFLNQDIASGVAQANLQQNQMLASRGIGSGGIRSALANTNANRVGEQVNRGVNQLFQQGLGIGSNLLNTGMSGLSSAGTLFDMAGQYGARMDERDLMIAQNEQAAINAQRARGAQNQKDAFTMRYNQAGAQDANMAGLWGGVLGLAGSVWGK